MFIANDLTVEIDGKKVLKNLFLDIPEGEVHLLMGPNGSGKTSLMMTVMGYPRYRIVSGGISLMGKELAELDIAERAGLGIGLAQQRPPSISGVKLKMLINYLLSDHPERENEIDRLINSANMGDFLGRNINEGLSGGEIKKSEILLLIARRPMFAMLDEPDSGVDVGSFELITTMINTLFSLVKESPAKRRTGLIITHSSNILESLHVDKTHIMINGQIVCSGNPQIIIKKILESGFDSCAECKRNEI